MQLDKNYSPTDIEQRWYQHWEASGFFAPSGNGEPYCIMLPPPNVTGRLHMGHAFQDTIMDTLTRYHRMLGDDTLWQPGTDHAGIATQMVVERRLASEGKHRRDMGREAFEEAVWEWKESSGDIISQQMRSLGTSVDWEQHRFTMDEGLSEAVRKVFVDLHSEGLIYRGKRLVNWDPVLNTALSDLEVLSEEERGHLWHIRYPREDGQGYLIVATTRPETMLGDVAVAVHPEDSRYQDLVGQSLQLPLTGRSIPVIADDYVDQEFGTGCVKITPAHDFNDYDIGQRHQLPLINVLNADATLNDEVPEAYRGMDRFEARKQIVADLEQAGLLEKIDDHKLMIPRGDRSGAVVEPWLTDQWYVKIAPLAQPAIEAVETGRIRFVPENWSRTYFEWMNNIQDWCISRQLWWGHRIPAWYDDHGNIYVGLDEASVRRDNQLAEDLPLRQDEDVLDTWFSSALWPFSTLGWPEQTSRLERFYPSSVLVTGFDIIFFWVARMIMMGLRFAGDVPFREVYIHGLIRDAQGQKMSKSKGNVLDPLDLVHGIDLKGLLAKRTESLMQPEQKHAIEQATKREFPDGIPAFGTDALRFTFAALATHGRDIRFDLGRIEGYRNFCNKLWNAARFVLMQEQDQPPVSKPGADQLGPVDRWITSRMSQATREVRQHLDSYRFDLAAQALYEFTWNEFCDWYLELSKPALKDDQPAATRNATRHTLLTVLEQLLRLMHPVMPFITEEIWQRLKQPLGLDGDSIMLEAYPAAADIDSDAMADIDWLKQVLAGVRRIRSESGIAPGKRLPVVLAGGSDADRARFESLRPLLMEVGRIESCQYEDAVDEESAEYAVALVDDLRVMIPLAGLIDVEGELTRLGRQLEREQASLSQSRGKLGNARFVDNAPAEVVEQERERLAQHEKAVASIEHQISQLKRLR